MAVDTCSVLVFHLYIIITVALSTINSASSKCNKSFHCGSLGRLEFPLSDHIECGLFLVNCTSSPPTVQFGADWPWLEFQAKNSTNNFLVRDPHLQLLLDEKSCNSFWFNSLPDSPLTLLAYSPNITLLSCFKSLTHQNKHDFNTHCKNSYNQCDTDYYFCPNTSPINTSILNQCHTIQMPAAANTSSHHIHADLFTLLSATFQLQWSVSNECISCHHAGGICRIDDIKNEFWCKGGKNGRRTLLLASAICATVAFLGLCLAVSFLAYRCKKKVPGPHLLSRNISSDPSFKSDIDLAGRFYFGLSIFSYAELEDATHKFDPSRELGGGGFGTIFYGKLRDGREVAIKRLYEHNVRRVEQFMNEINILTCLRHPNLVSLYGCTSRRSQELLLVYEYIPSGTVADHLHGEKSHTSPLTWPAPMSIAVETATALAYLHSSDIIHRDVKTSNILLDKYFSVKVADFGLSKHFPNDVTHVSTAPQGTPGYVDPEYHQFYQLSDE